MLPLQAKNYLTRKVATEHKVKLSGYKQVLKQSHVADLPGLGAGNERVLLSYEGMLGLVDYMLAQSAPEEDVDGAGDGACIKPAGDSKPMSELLSWLQGGAECQVLAKEHWNLGVYICSAE